MCRGSIINHMSVLITKRKNRTEVTLKHYIQCVFFSILLPVCMSNILVFPTLLFYDYIVY